MKAKHSCFIMPIGVMVGSVVGTLMYYCNAQFQPWITPLAMMTAFGFSIISYLLTDWMKPKLAPIATHSFQMFIAVLGVLVIGFVSLLGEWLYAGNRFTNLPLIFLLDDSGSISQHIGYEKRKDAISTILDQLDDHQEVGLSVFANSSTSTKLLPLSANRDAINGLLNGLSADGSTNANSALNAALDMLKQSDGSYRKAHIVIITDGALDDDAGNAAIADQLYRNGCIISGIFVGQSMSINGLENYLPMDRRVPLADYSSLAVELSEQLVSDCSLLEGIARGNNQTDNFLGSKAFGVGTMGVLGFLLGLACICVMGVPRKILYLPPLCAAMACVAMLLSQEIELDALLFIKTWLLLFMPSLPLWL